MATLALLVVTRSELPLWSMPTIFFSPMSRYWLEISYSVTFLVWSDEPEPPE